MTFSQMLAAAIKKKGNPVLVGLDPRWESLPNVLRDKIATPNDYLEVAFLYEKFCKAAIDIVAPLVPAVKPQAAFFEQCGPAGMLALQQTIRYAREKGLIVVFDGKRNDIGSTAEAYAKGILGENSAWQADALTVSPYLGDDSIEPFVKTATERNAGIFVLVKTSNPGGKMLQDLQFNGKPLYRTVAEYVDKISVSTKRDSEKYGSVGAVIGATYPEQLAELRETMPNSWFLVPGYGSQGGTAKDVAAAFDEDGLGAVINNSRGIIFAYQKEPYCSRFGQKKWEKAVETATLDMTAELKAELKSI